ncbi:hypothetical protein ACHAXM_011797 [Skeletonema potamos]
MPKGKKYFTAALAAVKVKKIADTAIKKKDLKKQVSSSSSGSEYSGSSDSGSVYTSGDEDSEGSSYTSDRSDQQEKRIRPLEEPVTNKPSTAGNDDDDSSDSSVSNGCGEYRRREDLSPDSSVASNNTSNDEESGSSRYESESEDSSSDQHSKNQESASEDGSDSEYSSEIDEPQSRNKSMHEKGTINESVKPNNSIESSKKKSFFTKRPSFSGVAKNEAAKLRRPSTDSRGSQESISETSKTSKSSKGSKVSESSSKKKKLSFGAIARAAVATTKLKSLKGKSAERGGSADALYEDEDEGSSSEEEGSSSSEDSFPSRSSKGSSKISERSKASNKHAEEESLASSDYARKSKSSEASRSSKASKSSKTSDSKKLENGITAPSLFDEDQLSLMRRGSGSGRGAGRGRGAQVGAGRGKPPLGPSKSGRQANTEPEDEEDDEESEDTFGSLLQRARSLKDMKTVNEAKSKEYGPDTTKKYKDSAELSHSFKTQSLKNANANLSTSFTEEKPNAASDAKGSSSSRFASMMKDLKSSSDNTKPKPTPSSISSDGDGEDKSDTDDVHVFQAPTIVPDDDVPFEQGNNGGCKGEKRPEDQKSRFRTRSESMKMLLQSKSNPTIENDEGSESTEGEGGSDVEVDEEESDEESVKNNTDESDTTASSEDQQAGLGTSDDESSEGYSAEDDDEYYEEDQAMTILTPITEVDNETIASFKPKMTDDDSVERSNSLISPKASVDLGEQKTEDREESRHTSEGTDDSGSSHASTSSSDNASNNNTSTRGSGQINGYHEAVTISGVDDKKYQQNGMSNQMMSTNLSMPDCERLSMPEVIARVKSNDPNFKAINLDESDLNDFNATRLFFSLNENKHITHISLARNSLGDGSAASLAHVLHGNESIIYLCLRSNQIRDKGAKAMRDALEKNRSLAHLDLQDNNISQALLETVERRVVIAAPLTPISPSPPECTENGSLPPAKYSTNSHEAEVDDTSYNMLRKGHQLAAKITVESNHSCETNHSAHSSSDSKVLEKAVKSEKTSSIVTNLLGIDESVCSAAAKDNDKMLETAISSATESDERSIDEDALLLALSLALYNLDSEWALNTAGGTKTLGDRIRIAPWNITESYCKERESVSDSVDSNIARVADSEGKEGERKESNCVLWMDAFKKTDPRWQIRKFFNDMSLFGGVLNDISENSSDRGSSIFTVWRPTSAVAIAKMMRGEGVGKGLEIKGKSAKEGDLTGLVPFLQIHEEEHKNKIRPIAKGDRTKIFFKKESWRDEVGEFLGLVAKDGA